MADLQGKQDGEDEMSIKGWIIRVLIGLAVVAALSFLLGFAVFILIPLIILLLLGLFVYYIIRRSRSGTSFAGADKAAEVIVDRDKYFTEQGSDEDEADQQGGAGRNAGD